MVQANDERASYLDPLCHEILAKPVLKYHIPGSVSHSPGQLENTTIDYDDADETAPIVGSPTLREPVVPPNAGRVSSPLTAPSTPPGQQVGVVVPC